MSKYQYRKVWSVMEKKIKQGSPKIVKHPESLVWVKKSLFWEASSSDGYFVLIVSTVGVNPPLALVEVKHNNISIISEKLYSFLSASEWAESKIKEHRRTKRAPDRGQAQAKSSNNLGVAPCG